MGRSIRASEAGLKRAKEAFDRTGWTQEYLAGSVNCTRQIVINFLKGRLVDKRFFEAICRELDLEVADIADLEKVPQVKAILALLQEITGDTSIEIVDIEKGSIRLILEGSQESLEQIEALFKSGQLTEVEGIPVEDIQFVTPKIPERDEDRQAIDKKRLAFTIAGSVSSEEIQELKAAFTETSDEDEEIETDEKARLVEEIITQGAKGRIMNDADLSGAYLSGADLSRAYLSRADLMGADLIGADLSRADLSGADLSHADLRGADLSRAYLRGADLMGANLSDADLSHAYLMGANLSGAHLSRANLSGAYLMGANLSGADLSGADLSDAGLSRAHLSRVRINAQTKIDSKWRLVWEIVNQGARERDLIGIDLRGADLRGADLSRADLSRANLRGADLSRANLIDANLSLADLSLADLSDADLSSANLSDANLNRANLINADLSLADLSDAVVKSARFGDNLGLSEEMKLDLQRRGAIFEDSPGDRSGVLSPR